MAGYLYDDACAIIWCYILYLRIGCDVGSGLRSWEQCQWPIKTKEVCIPAVMYLTLCWVRFLLTYIVILRKKCSNSSYLRPYLLIPKYTYGTKHQNCIEAIDCITCLILKHWSIIIIIVVLSAFALPFYLPFSEILTYIQIIFFI